MSGALAFDHDATSSCETMGSERLRQRWRVGTSLRYAWSATPSFGHRYGLFAVRGDGAGSRR